MSTMAFHPGQSFSLPISVTRNNAQALVAQRVDTHIHWITQLVLRTFVGCEAQRYKISLKVSAVNE